METISVLPTASTEKSSITKNPTQQHKNRHFKETVLHQNAQQLKIHHSPHEKLS
jgi:hypothetical protein